MGTPIKKTVFAAEQDEAQRLQFLNEIALIIERPEDCVFIDESSFQTNMMRRYARSPKGERVIDHISLKRGKNQTLISALQFTGVCSAFILEGTLTGDVFEWYVEHQLCPSLRPGQTVFLDNLPAHHRQEAIDMIEECGCKVVFLPPYSPDLNPIEMLFSKLKALIRAGRWGSLEELWVALGNAIERVTSTDILGWFKKAYPSVFL